MNLRLPPMKKSTTDNDIQAVIFDMDGVIVDSEPIYDELFRHYMRDQGVSLDTDFYSLVLGATWQTVFETANSTYGLTLDPMESFNDISDQQVEFIKSSGIPLMEGSRDAIQQLSQHYTLAIVSSSARRVVEQVLTHHRLKDFFAHITAYEDVVHPKPHPQPYAMTMAALGITPEEAIVIEDSLYGAQSGKAAGAFVYALPDKRMDASKYAALAKVVYSFDEILKDLL